VVVRVADHGHVRTSTASPPRILAKAWLIWLRLEFSTHTKSSLTFCWEHHEILSTRRVLEILSTRRVGTEWADNIARKHEKRRDSITVLYQGSSRCIYK
jgi:hypothetical protein